MLVSHENLRLPNIYYKKKKESYKVAVVVIVSNIIFRLVITEQF